MGPSDLQLLHRYCERLQMVVRAGGHYREPFRLDRGIIQGGLLLNTIFNVVVDAVVHHWESLVAERAWGDIRDDDSNMAHPEGRTIRERDDVLRQVEEGHERMTAKEAFLCRHWTCGFHRPMMAPVCV